MKSPLFPMIHNPVTYECRVSFTPADDQLHVVTPPAVINNRIEITGKGTGRLTVKMMKIEVPDCIPVDSVEAAEDIIIALPTVSEHEVEVSEDKLPEWYAGILSQTLRYSNVIAACTRRSDGNVVLMGRDLYAKMDSAFQARIDSNPGIGSGGLTPCEPETVGRWEKKGVAVGGATVYVGDGIPANEVFVAYVGSGTAIDGPGGLLQDGDDLYLRVMGDTKEAVGNASDYVRRFRVTFK